MTLAQKAALSDPGRKRRRNEDAYVLEPPLFAVADGMGGAQAGEIASRIAATALKETGAPAGEEGVAELVQAANRRVWERAGSDAATSGMGTTMTVALLEDDVVRIGHVGDSRAYRIRGGRLDQLTDDHSLVAELVRSGKLSPEEADVHPQRSVITRALGTDPDVEVDTFSVEARHGDVFMLCSDGLTSMVDDDAILGAIERHRSDLRAAARALVDAANRGGGEDNITIVLFEIAGEAVEQTASMPAIVPGGEPAGADEDTLSGLEPVPAIDTAVVDAPGVEPAPTRRGARISRTIAIGGSLAVVLVLAALVVWGLSSSYFVGAQPDGRVAVYQGFPWKLFRGVRLYRLRYESPLLAGQLSREERRRLFDHDLTSFDSALREVKKYEAEVVP